MSDARSFFGKQDEESEELRYGEKVRRAKAQLEMLKNQKASGFTVKELGFLLNPQILEMTPPTVEKIDEIFIRVISQETKWQ